MYIDTHCHLGDAKITDIDATVAAYLKAGVDTVVDVGCNASSSEISKALAEKYDSVYFAAGFHPSDIGDFDADGAAIISRLAKHPKCVAIGEIGLDYHWEPYDKFRQQRGFITQLEIAKAERLPVSIHLRDATEDALKLLKSNRDKLTYGGVLHCFSGSVETAKEMLDLGLYISFGGTLTFKNANKLIEVAKEVPVDKCLTETDSPYLAPHPYRGTVNTPANVPIVCVRLAEVKGMDVVETAEIVNKNATDLFKKLQK